MTSAKNDQDLMNELLEPGQVVLRCKVGEIFFCLNNICHDCYFVSKAEALRYLEEGHVRGKVVISGEHDNKTYQIRRN